MADESGDVSDVPMGKKCIGGTRGGIRVPTVAQDALSSSRADITATRRRNKTRSMVDRQTNGSLARATRPLWFLLEGGGHGCSVVWLLTERPRRSNSSNRSLFASIYSTRRDWSVVMSRTIQFPWRSGGMGGSAGTWLENVGGPKHAWRRVGKEESTHWCRVAMDRKKSIATVRSKKRDLKSRKVGTGNHAILVVGQRTANSGDRRRMRRRL
jgi:hypothetical protein